MDVIEVKHLTKNYGEGRGVFDVSFEVRGEVEEIFPNFSICARQIVCLINQNASKPALLKLVEVIN